VKIVKDPFGNEIVIQQTVLDMNEHMTRSEDVLDDMGKVIEKPMMIFKMKDGPTQLYYLRAVGWNRTMLIGVKKTNEHFEVINYETDPPIERITKLHSKGERLI
jgi:hypothetical protein